MYCRNHQIHFFLLKFKMNVLILCIEPYSIQVHVISLPEIFHCIFQNMLNCCFDKHTYAFESLRLPANCIFIWDMNNDEFEYIPLSHTPTDYHKTKQTQMQRHNVKSTITDLQNWMWFSFLHVYFSFWFISNSSSSLWNREVRRRYSLV